MVRKWIPWSIPRPVSGGCLLNVVLKSKGPCYDVHFWSSFASVDTNRVIFNVLLISSSSRHRGMVSPSRLYVYVPVKFQSYSAAPHLDPVLESPVNQMPAAPNMPSIYCTSIYPVRLPSSNSTVPAKLCSLNFEVGESGGL